MDKRDKALQAALIALRPFADQWDAERDMYKIGSGRPATPGYFKRAYKTFEAISELLKEDEPTITIHTSPNVSSETQQALGAMIEKALKHFTGGALVWVCDNCKSDYNTEQTMCISCGKRKPISRRVSLDDILGVDGLDSDP